MFNQKTAPLFLKLSIASVFLYAAVAATIEPDNWIGYIPLVVRKVLPGEILLTLFSLYQAILAIWIIIGKKLFLASVLASITFLAIIFANFSQTDILFRDFAIFFASLALAAASREKL